MFCILLYTYISMIYLYVMYIDIYIHKYDILVCNVNFRYLSSWQMLHHFHLVFVSMRHNDQDFLLLIIVLFLCNFHIFLIWSWSLQCVAVTLLLQCIVVFLLLQIIAVTFFITVHCNYISLECIKMTFLSQCATVTLSL